MIVTTTDLIEGHNIIKYLGVVRGKSVDFLMSGKNVPVVSIMDVRGTFEKTCESACDNSISTMIDEAKKLGADAIIGVQQSYAPAEGVMLTVSIGTAVKIEETEAGRTRRIALEKVEREEQAVRERKLKEEAARELAQKKEAQALEEAKRKETEARAKKEREEARRTGKIIFAFFESIEGCERFIDISKKWNEFADKGLFKDLEEEIGKEAYVEKMYGARPDKVKKTVERWKTQYDV